MLMKSKKKRAVKMRMMTIRMMMVEMSQLIQVGPLQDLVMMH